SSRSHLPIRSSREREPRARYAQVDPLKSRRMEVPRGLASEGGEAVQIAEQTDANSVPGRAAPPAGRLRENAEAPGAAEARADHRRPHWRTPHAALGRLPGRLSDVLGNEEREGEAHSHHGHNRSP